MIKSLGWNLIDFSITNTLCRIVAGHRRLLPLTPPETLSSYTSHCLPIFMRRYEMQSKLDPTHTVTLFLGMSVCTSQVWHLSEIFDTATKLVCAATLILICLFCVCLNGFMQEAAENRQRRREEEKRKAIQFECLARETVSRSNSACLKSAPDQPTELIAQSAPAWSSIPESGCSFCGCHCNSTVKAGYPTVKSDLEKR